MEVENFELNVTGDEANPSAAKLIERLFWLQLGNSHDFGRIVDAISITRRQALSTSLYERVDGSLKWSGVRQAGTAEKWNSRLCCPRLAAFYAKVLEKYPSLPRWRRSVEPLPTLPPIEKLDSVGINVTCQPKKSSMTVFGGITNEGALSLNASGTYPRFGSHLGSLSGAIEISDLSLYPQTTIVWDHYFAVKTEKEKLPGFEVQAIAKKEHHHLSKYLHENSMTLKVSSKNFPFNVSTALEYFMDQSRLRSPLAGGKSLFWTTALGLAEYAHSIAGFSAKHSTSLSASVGRRKSQDAASSYPAFLQIHHHVALRKQWQRLRFDSSLLFSKLWAPYMDEESIPLKHRLFLGGAASTTGLPCLRGVEKNSVGGNKFLAVGNLINRKWESTGGSTRANMTTELVLDLTAKADDERSHQKRPLLKLVRDRLQPFGFIDAGILTSELKLNAKDLKSSSAASAGVGVKVALGSNSHLEVATVCPLMRSLGVKTFHFGVCATR